MKILLTLDYELFLGERTGTVELCLINPMRLLLKQIEDLDVKFTLFVDAAYLYQLNKLSKDYSSLANDLHSLENEIRNLVNAGHDVQLHIHPQWYYSIYDGKEWQLDQEHYKLTDVSPKDLAPLFKDSKDLLDSIVGYKTHAFRAGGFSAQPFESIRPLFVDNELTLDSSVCPGTRYSSTHQQYDYTLCPKFDSYSFEDDITIASECGRFTEVPISMYAVSPVFHWQLMMMRLWHSQRHIKMGDGESVKTTTGSIVERLTKRALSLSTIDGLKINYLYDSLRNAEKKGDDLFCVIGHPKLATPYSIDAFGVFCRKAINEGHQFITISEI